MSNFFLDQMAEQLKRLQNEGQGMKINFKEKLHNINDEEAFSSSQDGIHSIAQIIAHATIKKHEAVKCLELGESKLWENTPEDWIDNKALKEKGWTLIKEEFETAQVLLANHLTLLLNMVYNKSYQDQDYQKEYNLSFTLQQLLQQDHYHLGQLSMVIRMVKNS